jgi:DNA-directed RNA polymerase subunit beta
LSEEIEANKNTLKKTVGRKLAARVLKTWTEDFVDEDTGEVVSIDRNEVLLERDHVLSAEDVDVIIESGVKSIILTPRRCKRGRLPHHLQYAGKR